MEDPRGEGKLSDLIVHEQPELRAPRLVAAFSGWPDAAQVATRAVAYLREELHAARLAEVRGDDFYSFATSRPETVIRDGRIEALRFPTNAFDYWRNPEAPEDLILFAGVEPHLQWHRYVGAVLDLAQAHGVTAIYLLGGLYDNVPHTRPVRISSVVEDEGLRQRLTEAGVVFSSYEGPSSLHTALVVGARARHLPVASLWGHSPGYAQVTWNPRVSCALLETLEQLLGVTVDLTEARRAATYLDEALDKLVARNAQVRALIRKLEQSYGPTESRRPKEPPRVSESILREVEEILRRHDEGSGEEPDEPHDAP